MRNKVPKADRRTMKIASAPTETDLAISLIPFVNADDAKLPREQFLRRVMDRIVDNLSALVTDAKGSR